jgi:hypothetical protein
MPEKSFWYKEDLEASERCPWMFFVGAGRTPRGGSRANRGGQGAGRRAAAKVPKLARRPPLELVPGPGVLHSDHFSRVGGLR